MRDAQEVLKRPAGGVIGTLSTAVGSAAHLQNAETMATAPNAGKSSKADVTDIRAHLSWLDKVAC